METNDSRSKKIYKVTLLGSLGNLLLLIFKFVAGIVGHSSAMLADAVHSLSDFVTDIIVIAFVKISSKPKDPTHDYGHGKYETVGTVIISGCLFFVGCGILFTSANEIWRYFKGEELEAPGMIALIAALVSIAVKEGLYQYTVRWAKKLDSKAVEANAWHHRSDAFSSIGTTIGIAGAIFFGVKGRVLDPLAAAIVSIFIIRVAIKLFMPGFNELLEQSLPEKEENEILKIANSFPNVSSPHNLRTRRIGNYAAVDLHVRMPADMTVAQSHEITREMESRIRQQIGPHTIISIHVEPVKPEEN